MITILHIAEIILYIILAFNTGYLLLFAIASKFCRPRIYPRTAPGTKFAVLFPAYKEDKVIIPAIYSFLQQDYPRELYDIIVISDQMQESTNEALRQLPVRLLIADYTDSSKAKAMSLAMNATADIPYDAVVIMDADNTAGTSFLSELNPVFQSGARAVQAHRTAKNTNTDIAVLDAASEEINNSIFRSGHIALGLSSALIGSGMALEACWFRQHIHLLEGLSAGLSGSGMAFEAEWFHQNVKYLQTAGEDKELEAMLLQQRIYTVYLPDLLVFDEKTQKKEAISNQRKRWIAAQFDSLVRTLPDFPKELLRGNIDYCDKVFQWTLLPRIILIFCTFFFTILVTLVSPYSSIKWWILAFALFLALFTAIPGHLLNKQLLRAIFQLPSLLLGIASNLFKLKGVNKKFIHTEHGN